MFKKCKIIMLPTKEETHIYTLNDKLFFEKYPVDSINAGNQHLYILLDDEIKVGDWYIYKNQLLQCKSNIEGLIKSCNNGTNPLELLVAIKCKKIIATTDSKLINNCNKFVYKSDDCDLPQPSKEFIQKYCDKNGINEVMIEFEKQSLSNLDNGFDEEDYSSILKISPDNTITIRKIKDSWNREEVEQLLWKTMEETGDIKNLDYKNWIKNNL